jgi:hypothetical protein
MAFPYNNDSDNTLDNIFGNNGEDIIANLQSEGGSDVFSFINAYSIYSDPTYNPYCFNKGTYILCLSPQFNDIWVRVENLTQNTLVKTYKHGYRKIKHMITGSFKNDVNKFGSYMCKMTLKEPTTLFSELMVTSYHGVLVDSLSEFEQEKLKPILGDKNMVDDKFILVAGESSDFDIVEGEDVYTYYNFVLENDNDIDARYGVWANGVLTETPSEQIHLDRLKKIENAMCH